MTTTLPRPSRVQMASPRWESWAPALEHLRHQSGTLWIVSPFITTVPPGFEWAGVRVLTTLDPKKIATDSTSIQALRELQRAGANVRILPSLHAKVFLRLDGSRASGYSGSANLTTNADRHNKEVMTGPHDFDSVFVRQLALHWDAANRLTPQMVQQVMEEAARLRENLKVQAKVEEDVMVFSIETRILQGSFTLTEARVGVPAHMRTQGLRAGRVDYVTAKARQPGGELVSRSLKHLQNGATGRAFKLRGKGRYYAVPLKEEGRFHAGLQHLNDELRFLMRLHLEQDQDAWKVAFLARLEQAALRYNKADLAFIQRLLTDGGAEFERYLERFEVGVSYGTFLPLKTDSRPLTRDHSAFFQAVRENRTLQEESEPALDDF